MEIISQHCFKCHKDVSSKDVTHTLYCKERIGVNDDGGAVECGRLNNKECEFKDYERTTKND